MLRRRNELAWERTKLVADAALDGYVYAPAGSATHYHASYMVPWWAPSLTRIGLIGSQIFYRWKSGLERALAFRQDYAGFEPEIGASLPSVGVDTIASGVTVHFGGGDAETSVVVHHNSTPGGAVIPVAQLTTTAGVRVHRNVDGPVASDYAGEAVLSEDGA